MTKADSTNISRQQKTDRPTKFQRSGSAGFLLYSKGAAARAFFYINQILRLLLALSTSGVPTLPTKNSPYGGCAYKQCRHTRTPLTELRRASSVVPWITLLGRKVLAVPATSAVPEHMFSWAGNIMTKKRVRLSCDHLEELMYLHKVWPKVREWTDIKKVRLT